MQQLGLVPARPAATEPLTTSRSRRSHDAQERSHDVARRGTAEQGDRHRVRQGDEQARARQARRLVVEDYVEHQPIPGQPPGREGLKWAYRVFNEPFPDLEFDFADVIAEGDLVVGRGIGEAVNKGSFMGIPPTNKPVKWSGTRLFRMKDGKLVEGWINIDMLGMMQQLGVDPDAAARSEPAPGARTSPARRRPARRTTP